MMGRPRKWTEAQVVAIGERFIEGGEGSTKIAASFGVSRGTITGLLSRNGYRRGPGPRNRSRWEIEVILALKRGGASLGEIAALQGVSRGTIAGVVYRNT